MTRDELEAEIAELENRLDNLREQLEDLPVEPAKYQRPPRKGTMERMLWDTGKRLQDMQFHEAQRRAEQFQRLMEASREGKGFKVKINYRPPSDKFV